MSGLTEAETIAALAQLARAHGAESRAADIVAEHALRGRYRYSPSLGWLEWDGRRWAAGDTGEPRVIEAVRQFIDARERDLRKQGEGAGEEAYEAARQADMWHNFLSAGKIRAIAGLCRGMDGILTSVAEFDAHPDILNCHNGVVDLRTGQLHPSNPDLLLTHLAGGDYVPDAQSTTWDKALEAVHPDIQEWFQTRMGQAATGHTPDDDCLIVSAGGGENGKTATMAGIMRALGSYARLISHRILIAQPGQHPTELMDLRGLRLALLEETPEEGRLDAHRVKSTVGTPQITARRMRQDDVTFDASHTLFVNTNFLPQVDSTDHGTWRRLRAMPWPYRFLKPGQPAERDTDRRGDRTLKARLHSNPHVPAAVLAWIVEGAKRWYAASQVAPEDPPAVQEATAMWRATSDVGFQFASDRLTASANHFITGKVMQQEFCAFLAEQGKREWSANTINTRLPESLGAAGILVTATPAKNAKVRQGDEQSVPGAWPGDQYAPGAQVRMWRGVRFKTAAEQAGHLHAVQ
jgi:P4 family phage/plasmid primase-like protien